MDFYELYLGLNPGGMLLFVLKLCPSVKVSFGCFLNSVVEQNQNMSEKDNKTGK